MTKPEMASDALPVTLRHSGFVIFSSFVIFFEVPQITVLDMTSQDGYTSSRYATF